MSRDIKKVYIDSCVLVAFLAPTHKDHIAAREVVSGIESPVLSFLTLDESLYILYSQYKLDKSALKKTVISILGSNVQIVSIDQTKTNAIKYVKNFCSGKLMPRDLMHTFIMKENKIKAVATYDKDFAKELSTIGIKNIAMTAVV